MRIQPKLTLIFLGLTIIPMTVVSVLVLQTIKIDSVRANVQDILLIFMFIIVIIVVALSNFVARGISQPIKILNRAMEEISKGNMEGEIPELKTSGEVKELAASFNRMLVSLKLLMKVAQQKTKSTEQESGVTEQPKIFR